MTAVDVYLKKEFEAGKAQYAWVNGALSEAPQLPEHMKAFCVYEVIRIHEGRLGYFKEHMDRLQKSCKLENVEGVDFEKVGQGVEQVAQKCAIQNQNIKVLLARPEDEASVQAFVYPVESFYPPLEYYTKGIKTKVISYEREHPNSKILNPALKSKLEEAKKEGLFELLLANKEGNVTEGTRSNVFFVKEGKVYTAPAEQVLEGVTRDRVIQMCKKRGITIIFTNITPSIIKCATSGFISSTSNCILPIASVDAIHYDVSSDKTLQDLVMNWFNEAE